MDLSPGTVKTPFTDEAGRTRIEVIELKFNRVSLLIDTRFAIQDGCRRNRIIEFLNLNCAYRFPFSINTQYLSPFESVIFPKTDHDEIELIIDHQNSSH